MLAASTQMMKSRKPAKKPNTPSPAKAPWSVNTALMPIALKTAATIPSQPSQAAGSGCAGC